MNLNRRDFVRLTGIAGVSAAGASLAPSLHAAAQPDGAAPAPRDDIRAAVARAHPAGANMVGFAAPKLDVVRVGVIGIGARGTEAVRRLTLIDGVEIVALCDLVPERVAAAQRRVQQQTGVNAAAYTEGPEAWKKLAARDDVDLVYTCTPWQLHTPIAVHAMEHGKHVATEVPAAITVDQCWQLVETAERTRRHCMMLENCCYDFFELLTLNLARQGFFGELVHAEGGYLHNRLERVFEVDPWRLRENYRKGNLYPTHGLGPIAEALNLNYGDQMDYLVSMSSDDFSMRARAEELVGKDAKFREFAEHTYRGNMNTSVIRTHRGRTVVVQHDCSSPRVYSRIHMLSGTKAAALKYPEPAKISVGDKWLSDAAMAELREKHLPALVRKMETVARRVGGHGGMDLLMDWRLFDCLRNGLALDMTVYDAALWSVVGPLSEWSVANGSQPIEVPDFTRGAWKANKSPFDIAFTRGGGTTDVRAQVAAAS